MAGWDEILHPRGYHGKFAPKGGNSKKGKGITLVDPSGKKVGHVPAGKTKGYFAKRMAKGAASGARSGARSAARGWNKARGEGGSNTQQTLFGAGLGHTLFKEPSKLVGTGGAALVGGAVGAARGGFLNNPHRLKKQGAKLQEKRRKAQFPSKKV